MSISNLHVATIQPFHPDSLAENILMQESAWQWVDQAVTDGAQLVVLPEYFNVMGLTTQQVLEEAKKAQKQREIASKVCQQHHIWLLLPLIEHRDQGVFNTAHLFNPLGEIVLTYDKTHLTLGERQDYGLTPGDAIKTVDTEFGRVGVMICYDIYFPEVARVLALEGAQIILFPSLQRSEQEDCCMLLNRMRAMDSTAYLIRSSYGRRPSKVHKPGLTYGSSCIIGPDGSILANAGYDEGFTHAVIAPKTPWQRQRCHGMPPHAVRDFLNEDRRPELYGTIFREK
ncbi:carbon-nitrogen hydrolase family protein [bacterium AH-315-I18]|nr:carbon-nitrogen hydrolase family protein [bacterium AH-315-I18]